MAMRKRPLLSLAGGVVGAVGLGFGLAYACGAPPFDGGRGEIKDAAVCKTLGGSAGAADALRKVLPGESSYSFDDQVMHRRIDDTDRTYETSCFVNGGGKMLLVATAEMVGYDKAEEWVEDVVANASAPSEVTSFQAGDKAVASERIAAIYVPCRDEGPREHLSVVVELKRRGGAADAEVRDGLISLARGAALFAHQQAKCDAPAKVAG
ncbi:hypothetical protein ACIG54_32060 [Streptomyces achromogenes]|uniref:hypothetical protein n=1 Tax=Streptomyces achromogenes TaxID=67255 RepID=UPI0037D12E27